MASPPTTTTPAIVPTPTTTSTSNISDVVQSVLNSNNNDIIQHRLQTGLGISGGGRGSLTKCTVAVANLLKHVSNNSTCTTTAVDDADADTDTDTNTSTTNKDNNTIIDLETLKDQVAHEILLQQIELLKLAYTVQRNDNEIIQQKRTIQQLDNSDDDTGTSDTNNSNSNRRQKTIQELRDEYTVEQLRYNCYIEYETIAKILLEQQPTSCSILNKQIQSYNTQLIDTAQQLDTVTSIEKIRSSQFHFLLTSIQDLKHSISINCSTGTTNTTTGTTSSNSTQDTVIQLQDYEKDNTNTNALLATLEKEKLELQQQYFNQDQNRKQPENDEVKVKQPEKEV